MAIATVIILEGRSLEVKRELHQGIAEVMARVLQQTPEKIRVVIQEVGPGDYSVGGKTV